MRPISRFSFHVSATSRRMFGTPTRVVGSRPACSVNGEEMSVLLYVVLTVAIFALLGLVQKLVEGL